MRREARMRGNTNRPDRAALDWIPRRLAPLRPINVFVVPSQQVSRGSPITIFRQSHFLTVQCVILFAVVELFFDPRTHFNPMPRRDSHVAPVKEGVQVLAKQDAV